MSLPAYRKQFLHMIIVTTTQDLKPAISVFFSCKVVWLNGSPETDELTAAEIEPLYLAAVLIADIPAYEQCKLWRLRIKPRFSLIEQDLGT